MSISYTVKLTNAENLALNYVSFSAQEWIDNMTHERCRIAIDEIVKICLEKCLETNTRVPLSKEEMVELAFAQGWVKSSEERSKEEFDQRLI